MNKIRSQIGPLGTEWNFADPSCCTTAATLAVQKLTFISSYEPFVDGKLKMSSTIRKSMDLLEPGVPIPPRKLSFKLLKSFPFPFTKVSPNSLMKRINPVWCQSDICLSLHSLWSKYISPRGWRNFSILEKQTWKMDRPPPTQSQPLWGPWPIPLGERHPNFSPFGWSIVPCTAL